MRNTLFPFLLVSTVLHLLLMFSWYGRALRPPAIEQIPIEIFAAPEKAPPPAAVEKSAPGRSAAPAPAKAPPPAKAPREVPREKPTPAERPVGLQAKVDRPGSDPTSSLTKNREKRPEQPTERPENEQNFETAKNDLAALSRREPTLDDLLPPGFQLYTGERKKDPRPVRLDTREPDHKRYMERVQQALNFAWDDPRISPSVKRPYGVIGRAVVEFIIKENGSVENLHLVQSSGYALMDQEALRVVMAAARDFGPIPRNLGVGSFLVTLGITFENLTGPSYTFSPQ